MPAFPVEMPDPRELDVLEVLRDFGGEASKKRLISTLRRRGTLGMEDLTRQADYQALRRLTAGPEERGWIKVIGETRSRRVVLTQGGRRVLRGFRCD